MAEPLVGLRFTASAVPQPQGQRGLHRVAASAVRQPHSNRRVLHAARLCQFRGGRLCARAAVAGPPEVDEDEAMSIDNLHRFFDLNIGKWDGSFYVRSSPLIFSRRTVILS
jgi:hypothetical protein